MSFHESLHFGASIDPQNVAGSAWDPLDLQAFRSSIWSTSVAAQLAVRFQGKND
jgi:hypothetical protein